MAREFKTNTERYPGEVYGELVDPQWVFSVLVVFANMKWREIMNTSEQDQGISGWGISGYQVCQSLEDQSDLRKTMSISETTEDYGKYMAVT